MQYYDIKDTSQYSIKSLNDQLRTLFNKVYGDIGTKDIKANSVDTINIKDGAINNLKIGVAEIKTANIKDAAITSAKIGFAVITDAHISSLEADRIKADKINVVSLAASEALITNLTANQALITFLTSNYAHIEDGFIDNALVGTTQIANGSITNAKIVDLTANKINAGTLSVDRLIIRGETTSIVYAINNITGALQSENVDTINGEVLTDRTITADKIVAHEITANEIAAHTITVNEMLVGTITATSGIIASIDATKITTGTLDASKITVTNLSASSIYGGTLTLGGAVNVNGTFLLKDGSGQESIKINNNGFKMTLNRNINFADSDTFEIWRKDETSPRIKFSASNEFCFYTGVDFTTINVGFLGSGTGGVNSNGVITAHSGFASLGGNPKFTWSGTLSSGTNTIIHYLSVIPLVKFDGTLGNVVLTTQDYDINTLKVYSSGTWTGNIYFY